MPALHQDETRAQKAARQRLGKPSAEVIPFTARITATEIRVPQPGDAAPSNVEDQKRQQRIDTSAKLDWLDAVMADHRLDARAKVVAYCIMQHLNREAGTAFVSDLTISHKTRIPMRWMQRARNALRSASWIIWKRTRTANVYSTLTGPMASIAEDQRELKQAREERRMRKQELPQVAEPNPNKSDLPQVAELVRPRVADHVLPQVADIPLSVNPLDNPLKESIHTGSPAIEVISAFESFWQQYPRRVGKLKAEQIYNKIIESKQASAEDLLAGAGRYAAERAGEKPKFTKHPSTWLNGRHWMDESQPAPGLAKPGSVYAGLRSFVEDGSRGK